MKYLSARRCIVFVICILGNICINNLNYRIRRKNKKIGGAGHRSQYLSHAKRALYHLSYTPVLMILNGLTNNLPLFLIKVLHSLNCVTIGKNNHYLYLYT